MVIPMAEEEFSEVTKCFQRVDIKKINWWHKQIINFAFKIKLFLNIQATIIKVINIFMLLSSVLVQCKFPDVLLVEERSPIVNPTLELLH